jgi:hypothetical protein
MGRLHRFGIEAAGLNVKCRQNPELIRERGTPSTFHVIERYHLVDGRRHLLNFLCRKQAG